jgi:single-strand DNA-binding protein
MSLNRATIIGYLGNDPELRNLPTSGQPVASFAVATDVSFTDKNGGRQERVDWHQVVVYGKLAETCHKYLSKGRQIYVEGRLRTRGIRSPRQRRQTLSHRDHCAAGTVSRNATRSTCRQ